MTRLIAIAIWLLCLLINAVATILGVEYLPQISAIVALTCMLIVLITERRNP